MNWKTSVTELTRYIRKLAVAQTIQSQFKIYANCKMITGHTLEMQSKKNNESKLTKLPIFLCSLKDGKRFDIKKGFSGRETEDRVIMLFVSSVTLNI